MRGLAAALMAAMLLSACSDKTNADTGSDAASRPQLGLMTSLPILWAGNDAFASLSGDAGSAPHWAASALESRYRVEPLDILAPDALAGIDVLLLAQPRILTPAENVALDDWVRAGGHTLVMADPRLVGDYGFPLGDPRRPLDTAMLSPILGRWGLELTHDPAADTVRTVPMGSAQMAVAAAGAFRLLASEDASCSLALEGLLARCRVGEGRVVLLADATLLEDPVGGEASPEALRVLLGMAREASPPATRENAGTQRK